MMFIVATTSLPVDRLNADRLERRTLVPIKQKQIISYLFYKENVNYIFESDL